MVDHGVSQEGFEQIFDTLEAQQKNAPAGAETPVGPGLTTAKEWLMATVSPDTTGSREESLKQIAITHLQLTREHFEKARTLRAHYAELGRTYGLTNQQIGDALGITEARVRQILAGV